MLLWSSLCFVLIVIIAITLNCKECNASYATICTYYLLTWFTWFLRLESSAYEPILTITALFTLIRGIFGRMVMPMLFMSRFKAVIY